MCIKTLTVIPYLASALCAIWSASELCSVQHAACIAYRAQCWLVQANEQMEAQLKEAQRAKQASEAQAGQLQAAENRVRCMHVCAKKAARCTAEYCCMQACCIVYIKSWPIVPRKALANCTHDSGLKQQLHLHGCPSHLSVSATALMLDPARLSRRCAAHHV